MSMSKRLQIVVQDEELEQLRHAAAREGLTLSELARRVLHRARAVPPGTESWRRWTGR